MELFAYQDLNPGRCDPSIKSGSNDMKQSAPQISRNVLGILLHWVLEH